MSVQESESKISRESSVSFINTGLKSWSNLGVTLSPQPSFNKDSSYIVYSKMPHDELLVLEESLEQEEVDANSDISRNELLLPKKSLEQEVSADAKEEETFLQKTKKRATRKIFSDLIPNSVLDWFSKENLVPQSSPKEAAKFSAIYLFPPMLIYQSIVAAMPDIYELYHENGKNFCQALKDYMKSATLTGVASKIFDAAVITIVLETTLAYLQLDDDADLGKQMSAVSKTAAVEALFSGVIKAVETYCNKDSKEKCNPHLLLPIGEEMAKGFFYSFLFSMFQINNIAENSLNMSKNWISQATNALITGGSTYLASVSVASMGDVCRWAASKCSFFGGKQLTEDVKAKDSKSKYVPPSLTSEEGPPSSTLSPV